MTLRTSVYRSAAVPARWVLEWQTPVMPGAAFCYYPSEQAAREAEAAMQDRYITRAVQRGQGEEAQPEVRPASGASVRKGVRRASGRARKPRRPSGGAL